MDEKKIKKRAFVCTWNNYPDDWQEILDRMFTEGAIKYMVFGEEVGEQGTKHLQGHIDFVNARTVAGVQKSLVSRDIKMWIQQAKSTSHARHNRDYCKKDGEFVEWGEAPQQGKRNDLLEYMEDIKKNPSKTKLQRMIEFPMVMAKYPHFCEEFKLLSAKYDTLDWKDGDAPNLYIWGPPGVGKSRRAREEYGESLYFKMCNKWWDGYDGEENVLIEDLEPEHKCLSWHIKIWTDRYPFGAEIKRYTVKMRPKRIIITSNFSLYEIFHPSIAAALERRFKVIHME